MCFYLSPAGPCYHTKQKPVLFTSKLLYVLFRLTAGAVATEVRLCSGCVRVAAGSLSLSLSLSLFLSLSLSLSLSAWRKSGKAEKLFFQISSSRRLCLSPGRAIVLLSFCVTDFMHGEQSVFDTLSSVHPARACWSRLHLSLSLFLSLAHFAFSSAGRFLLCLADNLYCSDFGTCSKLAPLISLSPHAPGRHPSRSHHSLSLSVHCCCG